MQGRPFAFLGVHCDEEGPAREMVRREQLTWPMWNDPGSGTGPICAAWRPGHWPALFVLDHRGTIRYRHCPVLLVEEADNRLLRELEGEKHAS